MFLILSYMFLSVIFWDFFFFLSVSGFENSLGFVGFNNVGFILEVFLVLIKIFFFFCCLTLFCSDCLFQAKWGRI